MNKAIYPGSFDPVTNGHIDIIKRASGFIDELVVGVLNNPSKEYLFTVEERMEHLKSITKDMPNVTVKSFSGLLIDFAKENNAKLVIRGLRAVTDFEYEFQMALTNRNMAKDIETLFISTSTQFLYLSSSVVKEVAMFNGDVNGMVPVEIKNELERKLKNWRN